MENKKLKRFGRYLLLDHLVDGGMAKIWRARFLSEDADKIVAIKMIQSKFSEDESFRQAFLQEIKTTFGLNHPNIAQTYDYGMYQKQLYTAMEYVDGANLKQFLDKLKERKLVFPVEISVHIISQAAQGLNYAHNFKNKLTNESLNIVHRDISPHNIMLTFDGAIKIIDFGIAKTNTDTDSTQVGIIKGKISYLAPEYLEQDDDGGVTLDHRYDQFAIGITLWELLCSRKLFKGKNELAVLKQIQSCKIPPPSTINPNVPKELDQIVLKALSKDKELRFENMDQLNRALVKFLYSHYPDFNATDLSNFAKDLFKQHIKEDRSKLFKFGQINIAPYLNDYKQETAVKAQAPSAIPGQNTKKEVINYELDEALKSESEDNTSKIILEETSTRKLIKSKMNNTSNGISTRTIKIQNQTEQEENEEGHNSNLIKYALVASLAAFSFFKKDLIIEQANILCHSSNICTTNIGKSPASVSKSELTGTLRLNGFRGHHSLYIDDNQVSYKSTGLKLPIERLIKVKIVQDGYQAFEKEIVFKDHDETMTIDIPEILPKSSYGMIFSKDFPAGSEIELDINGEMVTRKLPLSSFRIPAGSYEATVKNRTLGTRKPIRFVVRENQKTIIEN